MDTNKSIEVELTVPATKDLREDLVRDLIVIASSIVEKNYGIKVVGRITYSIGDKMSIKINGVKHYLSKGIPSIKDLIDLIVMTAVPHSYDNDGIAVHNEQNSYSNCIPTNT